MIKIMLVEDDKSLREIYGVRLLAEGYDIKSAGDGEEALAMAVKEHPDLIISDVMMPKISGFDMLDILRATPETKNIKVIMMTALSSEDQRTRGESLGADRYLVKSQVGIEDVVRTVHEVLGDQPGMSAAKAQPTVQAGVIDPSFVVQPTITAAPAAPTPVTMPTMQPVMPAYTSEGTFTPTPVFAQEVQQSTPQINPVQPQPVATAPAPEAQFIATAPAQPFVAAPEIAATVNQIQITDEPQLPQPTAPFSSPAPASLGTQVMTPAIDNMTAMENALSEQITVNTPTQPVQPNGPLV